MSGSRRAGVGKKDAKELRAKALVPCVLYGGKEQVSFAVPEDQFRHLVFTPDVHTVKLDVDGASFEAILHDLQQHPVTDRILHADFLEVVAGKPVTLSLPVHTEGNSIGVKAGGKLIKKMRKLKVRGPIEKMPQHITINVENVNIGQAIRVEDMKMDGLEFLDLESMTVVTVQTSRNVAEETPAAGAAAAPAAGAAKTPAAAPAKAAAAAPAAKAPAKK